MGNDFKSLTEELKELNLPPDQFAVFGSGPARVRELLSRKISDLDLIVTEALWRKLSSQYHVKETVSKSGKSQKIDLTENIEVYKYYFYYKRGGLDRLIKEADVIEGIRYVKLEAILSFKKFLNRPKDRQDIKAIEDYLKKAH